MAFDEKITEIMRNIGIAENTLMAVQLEIDAFEARATAAEAREAKLREALLDAGASLAAAISLLERGGKAAKKAAPSDRMFDQMLKDYRASLERARAALETDNG
jgi:hypothetical protein